MQPTLLPLTTTAHTASVIHPLAENTSSESSHQLELPLTKSSTTHLAGSRIISLQKVHDAIQTITWHSAACQSPVELIREVRRNDLCSTLLAKCSKCNEEISLTSCNRVELKNLMEQLDLLIKQMWRL